MNEFHRFQTDLTNLARDLPAMFVTFLIGLLIVRLLTAALTAALRLTKISAGMRGIIISLAKIALYISLLILVLLAGHLESIALYLTGSTAIILFVLSSGAAGLISDTISGIMLSTDKHFRVGDHVIAGDRQTEGQIVSLDARKTRIKGRDGRIHVIPNSLVEKNEWILLDEKAK